MRTICHNCEGEGKVPAPTLAVSRDGQAGTMVPQIPCRECDGTGWLKGFVPPV